MTKSEMYKLIIYRLLLNILQMLKSFLVAVPLGVCSAVITIFFIKKYQKKTENIIKTEKRNAIILLVSYFTIMAQMAILFRPWGTIHKVDLIPFNTPGGTRYVILYAIANAVIFIPLGFLAPRIWKRFRSLNACLILGFLVSLFIELSQFILHCGVVQTEDLIMNTVGVGIGYWIYHRKRKRERYR